MTGYEVSLTILVEADFPEDAARKAQETIDGNTEYWTFDVTWKSPMGIKKTKTIDAAEVFDA